MGQPGAQHGVGRGQLMSGACGPGVGGELPGLAPALQPEEEERYVAAGVRVTAGIGRPWTGSAAAGETPGGWRTTLQSSQRTSPDLYEQLAVQSGSGTRFISSIILRICGKYIINV